MGTTLSQWGVACTVAAVLLAGAGALAADAPADRSQRLLLLYQKPDGHPAATHEYLQGLTFLREQLAAEPRLELRLVPADEPWVDGPEHLDGADGVVVFLAAGANWLSASPERYRAFERLAARRGGLTCLHWGMGTKSVEPVAPFARLFGGCHGGPDRKYAFLETTLRPTATPHPITRGLEPLRVEDEFYYALKWTNLTPAATPLMEAEIGGQSQTVAWAWDRPDGGRSFGFSGLHYHRNWQQPVYQQLVTRGVLWTLGRTPADRSDGGNPKPAE